HAGQPLGQLVEGLAAVRGLVDRAAGGVHLAWGVLVGPAGRLALRLTAETVELITLPFPGGDEERLRVRRADRDVDDAGLVVEPGQDALPGLAAVLGLEQPAIAAGAVEPSERADVDDVRVLGVDDDRTDLVRRLEPHVLPGLAAVRALVDAVAVGDGIARVVFAGPDPDDVLVGRGDGDCADGHGGLAVELVLKGDAVVVCLG